MKTIETIITVLNDGSTQIPPRPDLPPGAHRAVLVVEEATQPAVAAPQPAAKQGAKPPLRLHIRPWGGWPADATYRREEIYDDWGR